jgi:hypothetical protein
MSMETDGRWQLAMPDMRCRARVNPAPYTIGTWYGCGKPAVFMLDRRTATTNRYGDRFGPLWYGYCEDLDHCYHRVLSDGAIYFVWEDEQGRVERVIKALQEQTR